MKMQTENNSVSIHAASLTPEQLGLFPCLGRDAGCFHYSQKSDPVFQFLVVRLLICPEAGVSGPEVQGEGWGTRLQADEVQEIQG